MATKALLTVEDFVRLPESVGNRDVRYELVEGELVEIALEIAHGDRFWSRGKAGRQGGRQPR